MEPWTLADGLGLIRSIQQESRKFNYHVCLGGSVLNKGASEKDIDIYFLPMGSQAKPTDVDGLVKWLSTLWGSYENIWKDYDDSVDDPINSPEPITNQSADNAMPDATSLTATWNTITRSNETFWRGRSFDTEGTAISITPQWFIRSLTDEKPKDNDPPNVYKRKLKFLRGGEDRIDCFIL